MLSPRFAGSKSTDKELMADKATTKGTFIMIFLSMIPMLGAFLVWVPAAAYLALAGHPIKALFMVLWGGTSAWHG